MRRSESEKNLLFTSDINALPNWIRKILGEKTLETEYLLTASS